MKLLSSQLHGILDYATVLFLAASPSLFNMRPTAAMFTYSLALIHLIMTLFTDFELGVFRVIPLKVHGTIEFLVSVLLIIVVYLFHRSSDSSAFYFYLVFALVLFFIWMVTSYRSSAAPVPGKKLQ